jgi:hypothetical protein
MGKIFPETNLLHETSESLIHQTLLPESSAKIMVEYNQQKYLPAL